MAMSAGEIGSIQFKIEAIDLASATMARINESFRATAEAARAATVGGAPGGAGGAFLGATEGLKEVGASAKESEGLFGKLGEKFKETAGEAAAFGLSIVGIQAATSVFENLRAAVVDFPEQIDRARITFETFTGSSSAAGDVLAQIEGLSTSTPFSFTGLADAGKTLIALGTPAEQVAVQLKNIAAAVAAVGGGNSDLQRIALTLARIQDAGTVTALTMRQLQTEQIPGWQILETALGKTQGQLAQMLKTGQITSDVFLDAFAKFASTTAGTALAEQTNTLSGSFNVLTNASNLLTATALAPLSEKLTEVASAEARTAQQNLPAWLDRIRSSNDLMLAGFDHFAPAMDQARARGDALGLVLNVLDGSFRAFGSDVQTVSGTVDGLFGKLVGVKEQLTLTGTKSADLFPGLAPGNASGLDALTKGSAGTTDAVRRTREDLQGLKQDAADLGGQSVADGLTRLQNALWDQAHPPREETSATFAPAEQVGALRRQVDALKDSDAAAKAAASSADKAAASLGSIGQRAEASIPGLSAMDAVIFGTSQRLAGVQLQIEEKRLGRLESRPANSLGQQEALLQEQLKVEELQRQVGFGSALADLKGPKGQAAAPVTTGTKFKTGFASGGSFMVGGSGGTDSQLVQFWASPDEKVSISPPGGGYGGGGGATTIYVQGPAVSIGGVRSAADGEMIAQAVTNAFRQFTAGGGRPQGARDRRLPGAQQ